MRKWDEVIQDGFLPCKVDLYDAPSAIIEKQIETLQVHLRRSTHVREFLAHIEKGPCTDCPDSPLDTLVEYAACQHAAIDKSDPAVTLRFLTRFIQPVFELQRDLVHEAMSDKLKNSPWHDFFFAGVALAPLVDALWMQWFNAVVIPYQSLSEKDRETYKDIARAALSPYDHSVFTCDVAKRTFTRKTWAEAFPEEIDGILTFLDELRENSPEEFEPYFTKLQAAYACTSLSELDMLWRAADIAWVEEIPHNSLFVPVHGMEVGFEHFRCVSPEFRIEVRTTDLTRLIEELRDATRSNADLLLHPDLRAPLAHRLDCTDISVTTRAVSAGCGLNIQCAGQHLPNRQDVLLTGGKIFVDRATAEREVERYHILMLDHCADDTSMYLLKLVNADSQIKVALAHEMAHLAGRTVDIDSALAEEMLLLEQAKATLLGLLNLRYHDGSHAQMLELVANTVARVLRFLQRSNLEDATVAPHVRENSVAAVTLFESGVMRLTEHGIEIDFKKARTEAWPQALRGFVCPLLEAYRTKDRAALQKLAQRYCSQEHPDLKKLIAWINR